MIAHLIMFSPKPGLTAPERTAIVDALTAAAAGIAAIERFRIGRRIRHGLPGYEQAMREDYEYVVMIEVENLDALKAYLRHPSHAALGRHFTQSAAAALAYDYEIVDASQAGSLIGA
jgi:Stress responsive A/B Barrel Domain